MEEENVVHGPSSTIPPILCSSGTFLHNALLEGVKKGSSFMNEIGGQRTTYRDFLQNTCRLANGLEKYGVTSKNIVAICCENTFEYFVPVFACLYIGVPVVPINPAYTENELTHAMELCQPDVIFCSKSCLNKMLQMKKQFPKIKTIIVINSVEKYSNAWNLGHFIEQHSNEVDVFAYKPVEVDIDNHIAFIMFSSGTTGLPKGVVITHRNVNEKNAVFLDPVISRISLSNEAPPDYVFCFLPFFHAFGLHSFISGILWAQTIVVLEKFDPEIYLSCIEKYKVPSLSAAPPIMQFYAKSPLIDKFDLSHVIEIIVGAGPISESLEAAVRKRIPVKYIRQGYGMTESTVSLTLIPTNSERAGSCGKVQPNLSAAVKDLKTGRNLGPNQQGELCFKGGVIMKGYYKNAAANKETFTEDGFMRTGDIGYYDEDGFFYIVDRLKELIKYKGYQVAPAELEALLMTNPKILDAAVIGIPDADVGELPMAFVIKQPNVDLTEKEVQQYVQKHVSPTKYLRGGVVFVTQIPRNPSGKILRRELRKMVKSFKSKL